jgi:hypothetical protein
MELRTRLKPPIAALLCQRIAGSCFRAAKLVVREEPGRNRKGRDFGYALTVSSCEGANSVDACTVTAP